MIDTRDLTSYYPGYDRYCEPTEEQPIDDRDFYEDYILEKERLKMKRQIIDLNTTSMTIDEIFELQDYIFKNYQLIPVEILEGE